MTKRNKFKLLTKKLKANAKKIIGLIVVVMLALASGAGIDVAIRPSDNGEITFETSFSLHLADKQVPATIETDDGETVVEENIVTVEEVNSNQFYDESTIEELDFGQGETYPVDTPTAFKDATLGKCINLDGKYGSQCVDIANAYWHSYTDRWFSTCGTGAAKGAWNCKEYNAGEEFDLIYDATAIQAGDWLIFSSGQYGHVGMALGTYNNGYVTLLGENQGGKACEGGGAATNIINISTKSFIGAFRPKIYEKPEPQPIPISGCVQWHVERGHTMSYIMLECEGTVKYGEAMDNYAKSWYSLVYKPNQSVYDGWHSATGVGLYAGDDIEHRIK